MEEQWKNTWRGNTFKSMLSNQVNFVLLGSSAHGFMTIQVGPFSALEHVRDTSIFLAQIAHVAFPQNGLFALTHLTTPLCSGIFGCWVDVPARKHVEPLRFAQRTLTKSLGPTTLPGVSADTSWVTIVSWPIFCRICRKTLHRIQTLTWSTCVSHTCSCFNFSHLDLFHVWIPFSHLLHVSNQLSVKGVRLLVQHDLQLEDLADVRQGLAQHFVTVCLSKGRKISGSVDIRTLTVSHSDFRFLDCPYFYNQHNFTTKYLLLLLPIFLLLENSFSFCPSRGVVSYVKKLLHPSVFVCV